VAAPAASAPQLPAVVVKVDPGAASTTTSATSELPLATAAAAVDPAQPAAGTVVTTGVGAAEMAAAEEAAGCGWGLLVEGDQVKECLCAAMLAQTRAQAFPPKCMVPKGISRRVICVGEAWCWH
jgi:hypothetical protein